MVNYPEKASLHRRERLAGRFNRTVTLPVEIDPAGVQAECPGGVTRMGKPDRETEDTLASAHELAVRTRRNL